MNASPDDAAPDLDLERFRNYLRVLAEIQLGARLRSKVDASDIVQQSLIEAHQSLPQAKFGSEGELIAWLRTILAHNLFNVAREFGAQKRDVTRERSLAMELEQSSVQMEKFLASNQSTPGQQVMRKESAAQLATALAQLPEMQRRAIVLKHFHGRSLEEIGNELDRSTLAVAGLLKRGLQKLREMMAKLQ
jgi:RNA polymerase sigma-70 factor (ECF subfamily)